jgi:hypothetical protein
MIVEFDAGIMKEEANWFAAATEFEIEKCQILKGNRQLGLALIALFYGEMNDKMANKFAFWVPSSSFWAIGIEESLVGANSAVAKIPKNKIE